MRINLFSNNMRYNPLVIIYNKYNILDLAQVLISDRVVYLQNSVTYKE